MDRTQRFYLFLAALADAPAASTFEEAFTLIAATLNRVEDMHSGVPANPANFSNDGRLYPPQRDSMRSVTGRGDLVRLRARRHNVWIGENGAIRIEDIPSADHKVQVWLSKAGSDGLEVQL